MVSVHGWQQKPVGRFSTHAVRADAKCLVHNLFFTARPKNLVLLPVTEADDIGMPNRTFISFLSPQVKPRTAKVKILKKRSDFLLVANGTFLRTRGFLLQAKQREDAKEPSFIRVGFTCSKKVGNAVARNRAKRRLREVARLLLVDHGRPGWDYVLIGKSKKTADISFADLCNEFRACLSNFHQKADT